MNSEENFLPTAKQSEESAEENKILLELKPWVELDDEEIETVEHLAKVGFDVSKIARVLDKDLRLFKRDFFTAGTPLYNSYQKGLLTAKATVDAVLLENAEKGNLTAMQQYYKILEETNAENIRQEIFNNEG